MSRINKLYGTFSNYDRNSVTNCCIGSFVGCTVTIAVAIFLAVAIGFDIAIIIIGAQHGNTTCDDGFHTYRLSEWLIIFGSVNLIMFVIFMSILGIILCISPENSSAPVAVQMIVTLIWLVFTFTMIIMGIIELVHVFPKCIVEEYTLSVTVLVVVILKFVFMCCTGAHNGSK